MRARRRGASGLKQEHVMNFRTADSAPSACEGDMPLMRVRRGGGIARRMYREKYPLLTKQIRDHARVAWSALAATKSTVSSRAQRGTFRDADQRSLAALGMTIIS
jgi:hypothetical protein